MGVDCPWVWIVRGCGLSVGVFGGMAAVFERGRMQT